MRVAWCPELASNTCQTPPPRSASSTKTWWGLTAAIPGAGAARGNRYQLAASQRSRTGRPNTRTAAPHPQNCRAGQPAGCATIAASCNARITGGRRAGRSRFTLQTLPESDFPDLAPGDMTHKFVLKAADLKRTAAVDNSRRFLDYYGPFVARQENPAAKGDRGAFIREYTERNPLGRDRLDDEIAPRAVAALARHREVIATGGRSAL